MNLIEAAPIVHSEERTPMFSIIILKWINEWMNLNWVQVLVWILHHLQKPRPPAHSALSPSTIWKTNICMVFRWTHIVPQQESRMADAGIGKEVQALPCQLIPPGVEPALVSKWTCAHSSSPHLFYYMEFFSHRTSEENPKEQDGKWATHSWIVASEFWSQVKEASENCTTVSVEKRPLF